MKRLFTVLAVVGLLALIPSQAAAGPILADPIIGVRGLALGDSAMITDPSMQPFNVCNGGLGLPPAYICSDYEITPTYAGGIFSLDLTFQDAGTPIPVGLIFLDPLSGFTSMTILDAFTIRLAGGAAFGGALSCGTSGGIETAVTYIPCTSFNDAVVFISDQARGTGPYTVAVTGINGVSTIPEPGSLVLMGSGLALLARRAFRRRSNRLRAPQLA